MTWNNPPPIVPTKAKAGKRITPEQLAASGSEDGEQSAVFCWAAASVGKYPELKWLHAIPNGGDRHVATASKMVATGLRSGVWDIFLPCPIYDWSELRLKYCKYHGCFIEMKREKYRTHKDGGLTEEQVEFVDYAVSAGYYCKVCYSWEE